MDTAIFELKFLRKVMLTPNKIVGIYLDSSYMDTDLGGMDSDAYERKRASLILQSVVWGMAGIMDRLKSDVDSSLFPQNHDEDAYRNINDDQINAIMEIMNFHLLQCKSRDISIFRYCRTVCMVKILQLIVVLLESNRKMECEAWIKEHLSTLRSVRNNDGDSILHLAITVPIGGFNRISIVKVLVEKCNMDVNAENRKRQTPLHVLSGVVWVTSHPPIEKVVGLTELLINNGAHMDSLDVLGNEASHVLSRKFPRWSFNVNLKCLAARAILKHGVKYEEKGLPATLIPFIHTHKRRPARAHFSRFRSQ